MQKGIFRKSSLFLLLVLLLIVLGACNIFFETNNENENSNGNNKENTSENNNHENSGENNNNGNNDSGGDKGGGDAAGGHNNDESEGEGDDGEESSILEDKSPFPRAVDIVNYFDSLHFVLENHDGNTVTMFYETKGEEELQRDNTKKIYVEIDYENDPDKSHEFDFWISDRYEEAIQVYSYAEGQLINPGINDLDGMFEESFEFFMDAFNLFHDNYRMKIKDGQMTAKFDSAGDQTIGGLQASQHHIKGSSNSGQDFSLELADFGDFEITLQSEDKGSPNLNRKFEIQKISVR